MSHLRRFVALFVLIAVATACGQEARTNATDESVSTEEVRASFPATIDAANGAIEIEQRPQRIVSLSPTATEILFAINAGDQVVAVDDQSDYPADAPMTKLSGFEPNIEAIAEYEPDLVIAQDDSEIGGPMKSLEIPLLVQPAATTLDETYAQIEQLGMATGNLDESKGVVESMRADIEGIVASLDRSTRGLSYYHELDDTYYTVTSKTFIGHVYELIGLRNIADKADKTGTGYPQLSAEYIIEEDPDLIFLADTECCNQSAETVAERPGWNRITAVRNDGVVELEDDVASRWGPRVVELLQTVADAVAAAASS